MNAVPDQYSAWDAAYVLGALSPVERREFEEHLAGCPTCQAAVSELAGLPGLLAQVAPDDAALLAVAPADVIDGGPPPDLVSKVIKTRQSRRRRLVLAVAGAVAALAVIIGGVAVATGLLPLGPRVAACGWRSHRWSRPAITALADVTPVSNGTDIKMECVYGEDSEPTPGGGYADYSIFVVDRSGQGEQIKSGRPSPTSRCGRAGTRPGGSTRSIGWRFATPPATNSCSRPTSAEPGRPRTLRSREVGAHGERRARGAVRRAGGGDRPAAGFRPRISPSARAAPPGWMTLGQPDLSRPVFTWITARMTHVYCLGHRLGRPGDGELAAQGLSGLLGRLRDRRRRRLVHQPRCGRAVTG